MVEKQTETPLISIVVPVYNHEKFVRKTLDSVLEDGYGNKELVIIDDGSSDRSKDIVEEWIKENENRIAVKFKSRENRGLTRTLNELIDWAEGEFITILASDDYLLPGGLEKRLNYLREHPEKLAVFGDCIVIDEEGNKIYDSGLSELHRARKKNLFSPDGIKREFILRWSVPGPVLMVRKEIYDVIGRYDETLHVEDWDFYLRMAAREVIGFIDEKVAAYRWFDRNVSKEYARKGIISREFMKVILKNCPQFELKYRVMFCKVFLRYVRDYVKSILKR